MKITQKVVRSKILDYTLKHGVAGSETLRAVAKVDDEPDFLGLARLYFAILYLNGNNDAGRVLSALTWFAEQDKPIP